MKYSFLSLVVAAAGCVFVTAPLAGAGDGTAVALGTRYHVDHSVFTDLPYDDGDFSYALALEYREGSAYWQLGLDYAPDVSGSPEADYLMTPFLNLMLADKLWRGGVGVLGSYVKYADEETDSDWLDVYYQFMFGVSFPVGKLELDMMAYYPFENWSDIDEFEFGDVEGGVWLRYAF